MRQVSSPRFFIQAFIILFSAELMMGMFNPSYVQLFFDHGSPFYALTDQHAVYYGFFMMLSQLSGLFANLLWGAISDRYGRKVAIAFAYFERKISKLDLNPSLALSLSLSRGS